MIEIPITIDSLHRPANAPASAADQSRCIFFTVRAEDPFAGWTFLLQNLGVPLLFLGAQGVLYQPLGGGTEFQSYDELDRLIHTVERAPGAFSVETDLLWLPTDVLQLAYRRSPKIEEDRPETRRGDVYRIALDLFAHHWRLADGRADPKDFPLDDHQLGRGPNVLLRFSPGETLVFTDWTERQFTRFPGQTGPGTPP